MKTVINNRSDKRIRFYIVLVMLFSLLVYASYQARNLIIGPQISITEPLNGTEVSESLITIEGKARNIAYISLNDSQIFVNDKGIFKEKLIVQPGYNIMKIASSDRFGRTKEKILELHRTRSFYSPPVEINTEPTTDQEISTTTEQKEI